MNTTSLVIDSVHLRVSNLERSVDFYRRQVGFVLKKETRSDHASLGTGSDAAAILELTEDRNAASAPANSAGLFHAALLLPSRASLGAWLQHAAGAKAVFDGFSDHGVSEAIYFRDPDGNGLEFYADRPREAWPRRAGELDMITAPLDVRDLLSAAGPARESPLADARWGHLHFRVSDLDRAERFYASTLGMTVTQRYGSSARFLASDGYHHHVGLNTWGGIRTAQPAGALGLIAASLRSKTVTAAQTVHDPGGIGLILKPL